MTALYECANCHAELIVQNYRVAPCVCLCKALEAELADICTRLGGGPEARLDGENGLAAAVMRAHDQYEAMLKSPIVECDRCGKSLDVTVGRDPDVVHIRVVPCECGDEALRKAAGEEIEWLKIMLRHRAMDLEIRLLIEQSVTRLEAATSTERGHTVKKP